MEESDTEAPGAADLQAVTSYLTDVAGALLPHRRIGLMHGKLKPKEKAAVMEQFKNGELDVLVATTIIESGIDNPHTNTLIIEDSQRYGLAQMYQLKGRAGRSCTQRTPTSCSPSTWSSPRRRPRA